MKHHLGWRNPNYNINHSYNTNDNNDNNNNNNDNRNRNIDNKNENNDDYNNTNNIVCLKVTSQCNKAGFGTPITRTQQVDENKGKKI